MSYRCCIHFISNVKKEDVYECIRKEINAQKGKFQEIAEENINKCFWKFNFPDTKEELTDPEYRHLLYGEAVEYLAKASLGFQFIYWKELELLGIIGNTNNGVCVQFQNSTDQDYPFTDYKGIDCFSPIVEKYKNMSNEDITKAYKKEYGNDPDIDIEYYRRSFCYDEIFDLLELNSFLYDKENFLENHPLLFVDVLETMRDESNWRACYRKAVLKYYDEERQWFK